VKASAEQIRVTDKPPVEPIDESALVAKLKEAGDHNADVEKRRANREAFAASLLAQEKAHAEKQEEIQELQDKIAALTAELEGAVEIHNERKAKLANADPLPEVIDTSAVAKQLNSARDNNQQHAEWAADRKRRTELLAAADKLAAESEEITKRIDQRQKDKQAAIAAATLPIDGISFGEGSVLLNELPFEQASDAEKLRTSVAIAMAANPKLRVVRIRDGSLLDEDGLKLVAEMADARDCQVWIERVASDGKVGIVLENGYIKTHDEEVA
jgi:hypothetical protein